MAEDIPSQSGQTILCDRCGLTIEYSYAKHRWMDLMDRPGLSKASHSSVPGHYHFPRKEYK